LFLFHKGYYELRDFLFIFLLECNSLFPDKLCLAGSSSGSSSSTIFTGRESLGIGGDVFYGLGVLPVANHWCQSTEGKAITLASSFLYPPLIMLGYLPDGRGRGFGPFVPVCWH